MQWLAIDEADLILSYGHEEDIHNIAKLVALSSNIIISCIWLLKVFADHISGMPYICHFTGGGIRDEIFNSS